MRHAWQRRALAGLIAGALAATGCATAPSAPVTADTAASPPVEEAAAKVPKVPEVPASPRAYYHFMRGYQFQLMRENAQALSEYLAALAYQPTSRALLIRTAEIYLANNDLENAIETVEVALSHYPDDQELVYFAANLYQQNGDLDQAEKHYRYLIAQNPDELKPYYLLILAYIRDEVYDQARLLIRETRERDPDSALPDYYTGRIFRVEGNARKAIKSFKRAIRKDRAFEPAYLDLANLYELEGHAEKAQRLYEQMVREVNPASAMVRNQLVQIYLEQGDLDRVLEQLNAMLEYNPRDPSLHYRVSVVLMEQGKLEEAIESASRVLALFPSDIRALSLLGGLYQRTGQSEEARTTYRRILELDPEYYRAHISLGYLAKEAGDQAGLDEAVEAITRQIEETPDDVGLYLFLNWAHTVSKRYEQAADIAEKGLAVFPDNEDLHFSLGASYYELKRHDDMVTEMQWVIAQNPRHADALNFLGYSWAERGERLDESIELVKRALKERPDTGFFLDSLAWAYYMKGNYKLALKYQLQAMEHSKEPDPVLFDHLGAIYLQLGRTDKAREAWIDSLTRDPDDDDLRKRFQEAGFGDPDAIEKILKAGQDAASKDTAAQGAAAEDAAANGAVPAP